MRNAPPDPSGATGTRAELTATPTTPIVVLTTAEDAEQLARLGRALVDERLAACVTVVPAVRSIYRWRGEVEDCSEALGLIKTTWGRYQALQTRWAELHPYDVPELIALPVAAGLPAYLAWLIESTADHGAACGVDRCRTLDR